jgi:hypothetical protein
MQIAKSRIWYFKELDQVTWRGRDVQVYSYDKNGSDSYRVRAKGAFWSERGWRFENGRFLGFPSAKGLPVPKDDGVGLNWEKIPDRNDGADISRSSPAINKTFSTLFLALPDDDPRPHAMLRRTPESLGYNELDEIIENYPNSIELHFLRLTIQGHLPVFLGYNDKIETDKTFIQANINELKDDSDLKTRILEYLSQIKK